jgi:hypothetical protein
MAAWVDGDTRNGWATILPAVDWIASGHATCNVQCHGCSRMVDVRLDALPQDRPWSRVGWCLVCNECGAAGSVNIVQNRHDMRGHAVPFSPVLLGATMAGAFARATRLLPQRCVAATWMPA